MAVRRDVFFDIEPNALLASLNDSEEFLMAFNDGKSLSSLNQLVYNAMVRRFGDYVDEVAKMSSHSDPRGQGDFHHLYETGAVGEGAARLFEFGIPAEVRRRGSAELFGRLSFIQAQGTGWSFGIRQVPDDSRVYRDNVPVFRRKAEVFEMGEPITLKKGTRFYMRYKDNYRGKEGEIPYVKNTASLVTSTFDTYHRLHEEFASFIASGMGKGVVKDRMDLVERVAIPEVARKLSQKIRSNNAKYGRGQGSERSLNFRVFEKKTASHISNEYTKILRNRLEALIGVHVGVTGE